MNNKMAVNTYLSTIEFKKQNKQAEQNQGYKVLFDGCQIGGRVRGMGEKGEEIKKYKLIVTE